MFNKIIKNLILVLIISLLTSCGVNYDFLKPEETKSSEFYAELEDKLNGIEKVEEPKILSEKIFVDMSLKYATYSVVNDGYALLYKQNRNVVENLKNITVCVNAGHGAKGVSKLKTFSHPDFSPKYAGGTTATGQVLSSAISDGTVLDNGMNEADANLLVACRLKDKLLADGYDVLMIREDSNSRLDNIARTVLANKYADCHVAIHFDSTDNDKGIFYITPINNPDYLNMQPLKSNVKNIKKLGNSIIEEFREMGEKIWKTKGTLAGDLTQLSYSTNASVDIELGDRKTEITEDRVDIFAEGIKRGIGRYFND